MAGASDRGSLPRSPTTEKSRPRKRRRRQKTVAQYNRMILAKIQRTLEENPTADLQTIIPQDYTSRRTAIHSQEQSISSGGEKGLCLNDAGTCAHT